MLLREPMPAGERFVLSALWFGSCPPFGGGGSGGVSNVYPMPAAGTVSVFEPVGSRSAVVVPDVGKKTGKNGTKKCRKM